VDTHDWPPAQAESRSTAGATAIVYEGAVLVALTGDVKLKVTVRSHETVHSTALCADVVGSMKTTAMRSTATRRSIPVF
jgi:hypothetical protein